MRLSCSPCTGAVTEPVSSQTAEVSYAVILTKQEAARSLRCTPRYIERQIRAGRLRACKSCASLPARRRGWSSRAVDAFSNPSVAAVLNVEQRLTSLSRDRRCWQQIISSFL